MQPVATATGRAADMSGASSSRQLNNRQRDPSLWARVENAASGSASSRGEAFPALPIAAPSSSSSSSARRPPPPPPSNFVPGMARPRAQQASYSTPWVRPSASASSSADPTPAQTFRSGAPSAVRPTISLVSPPPSSSRPSSSSSSNSQQRAPKKAEFPGLPPLSAAEIERRARQLNASKPAGSSQTLLDEERTAAANRWLANGVTDDIDDLAITAANGGVGTTGGKKKKQKGKTLLMSHGVMRGA